MIKIAPSILSADFTIIKEEIKALEAANADIIHIDVMDGHFVPNLTFAFPIIEQIRKITPLPMDTHLMVTNPENYFSRLAKVGVNYISMHKEVGYHHQRMITQIKEKNVKAGIALNPATDVRSLDPIVKDLDFILIMSVNPGFGGQSFLPIAIQKIKYLVNLRQKHNLDFLIEVDGGINKNISQKLKELGADILVAGSYILSKENYSKSIEELR